MKLTDSISKEELKNLVEFQDWRSWASIATSWLLFVGSFALVDFYPNFLTIIVALVIIGGRQVALAFLLHEGIHGTLFRSKGINRFAAKWLCGNFIAIDFEEYKKEHLQHHWKTGSSEDPDLGLTAPYPASPSSLMRKFARDLSGITGFKRLSAIILMNSGYLTYTVSTNAKRIPQKGRTKLSAIKTGLKNLSGPILVNAFLFLVLLLLGKPMLYLLWVGSYLTTFSLFLRIRAIAEHACTPDASDPLNNTRTTYANIFAKLTVAPHNINYHLDHHLLVSVPHYNLPKFHKSLKATGALKTASVEPGYFSVLRKAASATK